MHQIVPFKKISRGSMHPNPPSTRVATPRRFTAYNSPRAPEVGPRKATCLLGGSGHAPPRKFVKMVRFGEYFVKKKV